MELEAIPGVGAKTAAALRELDDPVGTVESGDVAAIARAPGVNEARAARIARGAIRRRHDDDGRFLATDRAREVYRDAMALLQDRTVTEYAEKRLETFYPSSSASRIAEVQAFVETAVDREPDPTVLDALEGVEPLSDPGTVRVRDRCLATADAETYARAESTTPELSVETVENTREIAELARSYASVIVLDEEFAGMDVDGDVHVRPNALETPAETVPERVLAFFAENRERLEAAAAVHETVRNVETGRGEDPADGSKQSERTNDAAEAGDPAVDPDRLRDALDRLDDDGTIAGDAELARLADAVDDLDAAVSTAGSVAEDHLREAIRERDVTIEGTDFLSLVEQGARVDSLLDRELADEYDTAVERAREQLVDALRLKPEEVDLAERVFGGDPTFPVEHDETAVSRLRTELAAARDRRAARLKAELAAELGELREPVETLVRDALELDVELAISRFAREFDCTMPVVHDPSAGSDAASATDSDAASAADPTTGTGSTAARGFRIEGGRSPLLDVPFAEVDPVDYGVSGVTLLSGVNSGGKTSTLDLVALVVVLAQMGMPVPAEEAEIERFAELHYYAKSQGTLDAGAFEATLRDFGDLVEGASGRLVLVDELESITEPGASAKIIAGILEALDGQDATAVFVSHLAREIREAAATDVAVDGIEAVGLVDGELRVNRSPKKNHLARSTPELIVEKLADDRGGGFYTELLQKF